MKYLKWILYGTAGIFLVGVIFFVYSFIYTSYESITSDGVTEKLREFEKNETELLSVEQSYRDWKNIQTDYQKYKDDHLVSFEKLSVWREELISIIRRHSLEEDSLSFKYLSEKNVDIGMVSVSLGLTGTYAGLKHFVFDIENQPKVVFIKNIGLTKAGSMVKGKFQLEVYFAQ